MDIGDGDDQKQGQELRSGEIGDQAQDEAADLIAAFAGYGEGRYRNLVYFAACNVFRGERGIAFARRFARETGVQAVIGYATPVGWMASPVCDLLFLHRFYSDPAPWKNLRRIYNSVHRDYPAARRMKHLLITRRDVT